MWELSLHKKDSISGKPWQALHSLENLCFVHLYFVGSMIPWLLRFRVYFSQMKIKWFPWLSNFWPVPSMLYNKWFSCKKKLNFITLIIIYTFNKFTLNNVWLFMHNCAMKKLSTLSKWKYMALHQTISESARAEIKWSHFLTIYTIVKT